MNPPLAEELSDRTNMEQDVPSDEEVKPLKMSWGLSESNLSPREYTEAPTETAASPRSEPAPKTVLFLLNRNGLDLEDLRRMLKFMLKTKYASDDVQITWLSIFGKMPERPHAFFTLDNEELSLELLDDETIHLELDGRMFIFEISVAFGLEAKTDEDPLCMFVAGVPTSKPKEELEVKLKAFFGGVAPVAEVIFPREWINTKSVLLRMPNRECAEMMARTTRFSIFEGNVLCCTYARRLPDRPPVKDKKPRKQKAPVEKDKKGFQVVRRR